jgi:hypothetical protein
VKVVGLAMDNPPAERRVVQVVVDQEQLIVVLMVELETELLEFPHNHLHQIKDMVVELDMVLVQITLDLVEVEVVPTLLERMEVQIQQ